MPIPAEAIVLGDARAGSLQRRIQQAIASGILSGRFRPGERLPSSRALARHLGVSRITVTLAYGELVASGYVTARDRSGYFVAEDAPTPEALAEPPPAAVGGTRLDWQGRVRLPRLSAPRLAKPLDWREYPYPFLYGQPDARLFDQASWRLSAHQALGARAFDAVARDYGGADDPELVEFILRHSLPRRGILARPDEVLVTLGAQNALWILAQLLGGPGRLAAHENPCYPGLRDVLTLTGTRRVAVDVDEQGLPVEAIPPEADLVFCTPSHHAPTTVTMPMERRRALLEAAERHDWIVIEDDYEFEMSFLDPASPALKSLDRSGRVIHVGSFSKSIFPGLRLGYLVADAELIARARELRLALLRHPPGHVMRTTANFLRLGHYDAMIRRMRSTYARRREVMARAIEAEGLTVAAAARFGGSSFWMRAPEGVDTERLALELRADGVLIEPGAPFFDGPAPPTNTYRIAYSSIAAERIPEGIARIARAIERHLAGPGGAPRPRERAGA